MKDPASSLLCSHFNFTRLIIRSMVGECRPCIILVCIIFFVSPFLVLGRRACFIYMYKGLILCDISVNFYKGGKNELCGSNKKKGFLQLEPGLTGGVCV